MECYDKPLSILNFTHSVVVADFSCGVMLDGVIAGAVSIDPGGRVKFNLFFDILLIFAKHSRRYLCHYFNSVSVLKYYKCNYKVKLRVYNDDWCLFYEKNIIIHLRSTNQFLMIDVYHDVTDYHSFNFDICIM